MGVWGIYFTEIFFHFLRIFFYVFFRWKFFEFFFWKFFFGFFSIRGVLYRGNYKLCWNPHFYGTFLVLLIYNYLSRTMTGQKGVWRHAWCRIPGFWGGRAPCRKGAGGPWALWAAPEPRSGAGTAFLGISQEC